MLTIASFISHLKMYQYISNIGLSPSPNAHAHIHYFMCSSVSSSAICVYVFSSSALPQMISSLHDEIRELKQTVQNQDCTISTKNLEIQSLQEQLDLQRRYSLTHSLPHGMKHRAEGIYIIRLVIIKLKLIMVPSTLLRSLL